MGTDVVETQIGSWLDHVRTHRELTAADAAELEDHLRERIDDLVAVGLQPDEAFLVAVKRMGSIDALTREFAREHSDRLWKQLVLGGEDAERRPTSEIVVVLAFAVGAAVLVKIPQLLGVGLDTDGDVAFYARNLACFALAPLAGYLLWSRGASTRTWGAVAGLFAVGIVAANAFPLDADGSATVLTAVHLPIALWLVVGVAYAGEGWRDGQARMDFIRFTGEWVIYLALLALGGGVLAGVVLGTFNATGNDASEFVGSVLLPCGAAGAVVVAAWLVEAKKSVVENMAPVLGLVFTPLFVIALTALVSVLVVTGGLDVDRDALIVFDLLLVLVLGLLVYGISARNGAAVWPDRMQLVLVVAALLVDAIVLAVLCSRIGEFGFSANKTAALGENLVLLANLGWSAYLLLRVVRRSAPLAVLQRWQTSYLVVYAAWAWAVVLLFPIAFGFD
ncbi:MAG: permease prefix domain 1-containing protein [Marmoricola sp.]